MRKYVILHPLVLDAIGILAELEKAFDDPAAEAFRQLEDAIDAQGERA